MKKALFKYIFSLLLFGANGIVASYCSMTSYEIVLLRTFLGSVLLLALLTCRGGLRDAFSHGKGLAFIALSGAAMGAGWIFLYEAHESASAQLLFAITAALSS